MMEANKRLKKHCWLTIVILCLLTIIALSVCLPLVLTSDYYVWNFTDSKEDVYKYIVKSRYKLRIDEDELNVKERIDYLYNHNDSLVFDSLLTEILKFRTMDGNLKDSRTISSVMDWCKVRGKKFLEINTLRDSFLSLPDTVWYANLYDVRKGNSKRHFLSLIEEVICYMLTDSLAWKDNKDVYKEVSTFKMIREGLFNRLTYNGSYSIDSSSIPEKVKSHQCLFDWSDHSIEYKDYKRDLGYVQKNDTVCEIITVYRQRYDNIDRNTFCVIDQYYYGDIGQKNSVCNHFWHDRMVSKFMVENPLDCYRMRDSIFSEITTSSNLTYFQKKISHFE